MPNKRPSTIKVVVFNQETGEMEPKTISGLKDMQNIVGGLIEPVRIFEDDYGCIDAIVNEEGLLIDLPLSALSEEKSIHLVGPIFFARASYSQGDYVNLKPGDIKMLNKLSVHTYNNKKILILP